MTSQPRIRHNAAGHVVWTQPMRAFVRAAILEGKTQQQTADSLGVSLRSLQTAIYRHDQGLSDTPADVVLLTELAAQWGIRSTAARRYIQFRGVPLSRVGRYDALTRADAERLTAGRVMTVTERPPGHVTVAELGHAWGRDDFSVRSVVAGLSYLNWARPGIKRWVRLYDLRDVTAPAPLPRSVPNGYMNREEMAVFANRKKGAVARWVRAGCPHGRTRDGHLFFDPRTVATWLLERGGNVLTRRLGLRLTERLNIQERAA